MDITFLNSQNPWWIDTKFRSGVIERDFYLGRIDSTQSKTIQVLLGARRVGKSSILKSIIDRLLAGGTEAAKIVYLTADDPSMIGADLNMVIKSLIDERGDSITIFTRLTQNLASP